MKDLPSPTLQRHAARELTDAQARAICDLRNRVWPEPGVEIESRMARLRDPSRELFVMWAGAQPLATAAIFNRTIQTDADELDVMALAGVCTDPEHRGGGWGRAVVRAAFEQVDGGRWPVSLFQTGVPGFYEKLGSRLVDSRFINSRFQPGDRGSAGNPWWEVNIMIYPTAFAWPAGTIDLLGAAY